MNRFHRFLRSIKDSITDPNGYWCPVKIVGLALVIIGVVGYFHDKDPAFFVITGTTMMAAGKGLDGTVRPETPEQAAK